MANTKSLSVDNNSNCTSCQSASITYANQTGLAITGDLSIMAWVKLGTPPATFGNQMTIAGRAGGGKYIYSLYFNNNGKIRWGLSDNGSSTGLSRFETPNDESSTGWLHIAATFDASSGAQKIYVNGSDTLATRVYGSVVNSIYSNTTNKFIIGADNGPSDYNPFDGLIDEVSIWNKTLSSTEVSNNYNSGDGEVLTGSESNLQGYWRMEDNLLDETSNDNDLTNNNSCTYSTDVPFSGSAGGGDISALNSIGWANVTSVNGIAKADATSINGITTS